MPRPVGGQGPRLGVVSQVERQDLVQLSDRPQVGDGDHRLDPPIEIPTTEISRSDVVVGGPVRLAPKSQNARVLEEPADNGSHPNRLGHARHTGCLLYTSPSPRD